MLYPTPTTFVGFERLFNELNKSAESKELYPPHNIYKVADSNTYVLELACAGYKMEDIEVSVEKNVLTVSTRKGYEQSAEKLTYYHRGISLRRFRKIFNLDDSIEVTAAEMADGILKITLQEIIPDKLLRRTIEILPRPSGPPQFLTE